MSKVIFLILIATVSFCANAEINESVALAVGKIIVYEDKIERYSDIGGDPYSYQKHMNLIKSEFRGVQSTLPKDEQITFLWAVMVRSSFGSEYSEIFSELVYECCNIEFMSEIDRYLSKGSKKNKAVIHKAKFVKAALKQQEKIHNKVINYAPTAPEEGSPYKVDAYLNHKVGNKCQEYSVQSE